MMGLRARSLSGQGSVRTIGANVGRELVRGVLDSLLGGSTARPPQRSLPYAEGPQM